MAGVKELTKEFLSIRADLAHYMEGTCHEIYMAVESLGLDEGVDWEDELLNENIERCGGCNWWHECGELEWFDEFEKSLCSDCQKDWGLSLIHI